MAAPSPMQTAQRGLADRPRQSRPLVAAAPHPPHHRLVVSQHTQLVPALPRTLRNPDALFLLDTACRTSRSPITLRRYSGPCTHYAAGPAAYAPTLCSSFLLTAPAFSSQLLTTYSYLDTFPLTKKRKDIPRSIHPLSQVKSAKSSVFVFLFFFLLHPSDERCCGSHARKSHPRSRIRARVRARARCGSFSRRAPAHQPRSRTDS
ncbi:hypothetical protein C8J57DRAFT_1722037, partial [Mycena rebaudengoi]